MTCSLADPNAAACKAQWAPQSWSGYRGGWCTTPSVCKEASAHDRPNGIAEDEFKKSQLSDATDKSSWKVIVAAKEADTQSGSKGGKGGKGSKGGRGSLGGKGGKGGKSGKGGKGSGSRGINKTGQRFHRP